MRDLSTLFRPITAIPDSHSEEYVEIQPCPVLRPYIRCFWGEPEPFPYESRQSTAATPDACMDIVIYINYSTNEITSRFCGIDDVPLLPSTRRRSGVISYFGIRFYFWAVHLFVRNGLSSAANASSDVGQFFPDFRKKLEDIIVYHPRIEDRAHFAELYLLNKLQDNQPENHNFMNAVDYIVRTKGMISVRNICSHIGIGQRHLERIFSEYIGLSPKRMADVVRYQNVWQDLFYAGTHNFNDIVYDYGYSDQSHLVNDFEKHHGRTPLEALRYARNKMSDFYNTKLSSETYTVD